MKETFHLEQPEKKTCWKTLQKGMSHRCAFCPVEKLMRGEKSLIWEETNSITGRIYENYDSLMRWIDGRIVHFQQSVDITERKSVSYTHLGGAGHAGGHVPAHSACGVRGPAYKTKHEQMTGRLHEKPMYRCV